MLEYSMGVKVHISHMYSYTGGKVLWQCTHIHTVWTCNQCKNVCKKHEVFPVERSLFIVSCLKSKYLCIMCVP